MKKTANRRLAWWFVGSICMLVVIGCGKASNRLAIEGTVTIDGQQLAEGSIAFLPQQETGGPASGGIITDGKFSVSPDGGVFEGKFRVEITASRKTGRQESTPTGKMVDQYKQYLPEKYNRQSELTVEVTKDGPNHFEFTLSSS